MRPAERLCVDCPYVARIFRLPICAGYLYCIQIKIILFLQHKMEYVFICIIESVCDTCRYPVWLLPDGDVTTELKQEERCGKMTEKGGGKNGSGKSKVSVLWE